MSSERADASGWCSVKLGDLFAPIALRAKDSDLVGEEVPVLSMTRTHGLIRQSEKFDKRVASRDTAQYKLVHRGELVYGFPIDEGVIAVLHRYARGLVSPAYQVLRPIREFEIDFIDQLLRTPALIAKYISLSSNTVERRRNLAVRDFLNIDISFPPLVEQRKIAAILRLAQKAIEQQGRSGRLAGELKKSLLQKLFAEGLRNEPQVETKIGPLPESWAAVSLGDCCDVLSGSLSYADFLNLPSADQKDGVECMAVKVSDMNLPGNESEFVNANARKTLVRTVAENKLIPPGAVVFPKRGAAIATNKKRLTTTWTALDPNLIAVHPKSSVDKRFLFYWTQTFDLRTITDPGPTPQLNKKDLVPLLMPVPEDIQEQCDIAAAISIIEAKIDLHRRRQAALNDLFRTLLNQLMSAQICVRDLDIPRLESAVAA